MQKKMRPQNKSAKNMQTKMQKNSFAIEKNKQKCKKHAKNMQILEVCALAFLGGPQVFKDWKNLKKLEENTKKCDKNANSGIVLFLHFWEGLRLELQKFKKLQKLDENAKNNPKKSKFWNYACFAKNTEVAFLFACWLYFFAFFWATVFGVALSGCIFLACFFHFNQVLPSLE